MATLTPIKSRRLAAGLSQQQLAAKADCSISMVQMLERGYKPKDSSVEQRIARVLNLSEAK